LPTKPGDGRVEFRRASAETLPLDAGLTACAHLLVTHTLAADWQTFAHKMALRAYSSLAHLPDREFEAGLAELRRHAAVSEPEEITEPIDVFVFERGG
jgi:hypothetical protein